jgi:hypothetical protein
MLLVAANSQACLHVRAWVSSSTDRPRFHCLNCVAQDNFVSYTMQAAEQANLDRIAQQKSRLEIPTPLEPLLVGLIKGFVDDADLTRKLRDLYKVIHVIALKCAAR